MEYGHAFFLYTLAIKVFDALIIVAAWHFTWFLRFNTSLFAREHSLPHFSKYSAVSVPIALAFSAVFHVVGAYRKDRIRFGFKAFKKITQGSIIGMLVFVSVLYFLYEVHYSRIYLLVFLAVAWVFLTVERAFLEGLFQLVKAYKIKKVRVLLVGTGSLLETYVQKLNDRKPYPIHWVGRLGPPPIEGESQPPLVSWIGIEEQLEDVLRHYKVDSVIISYPTDEMNIYEQILETLSNELVSVKVLPDFGRYSTFTYSADQECGIPLLNFNQPPLSATDRAVKRIVDVIGSLFCLVLFSPLFLIIGVLVKLTSRGPAIYGQTRIGADGHLFTCYKFRSMKMDAEANTGAVWATENDNRTTKVGKWIRRTSLDELPQFFNVLRGDMSLVGPRPERPFFVDQFRKEIPKYMLRHRMKSGITGWAQINGWRGNTSIEERINHDLFYIGHWSHRFDIKILLMTFVKGFVNRHAY